MNFPTDCLKFFETTVMSPPHTVHDNLLGWIYDNFRKIKTWFSIALKQKSVSLSDWAESMHNPNNLVMNCVSTCSVECTANTPSST